MKVLMVTPTYYPVIGGVETFIQTITNGLNERKVHVDVMTFNTDEKGELVWKETIEMTNNAYIIRIPALRSPTLTILGKPINPLSGLFRINFIPYSNLKRRLKNYDIVHFHNEWDLSFPFFLRSIKKPKIFHYHGLGGRAQRSRMGFLCRQMLKSTINLYLCNSKSALELVADLEINKKAITIVPNTVNLGEFSPFTLSEGDLRDYENELNINHSARKVLYVSRLSSDKLDAITSVIGSAPKIAQEFPNVQILIVGSGPHLEHISKLASKINNKLKKKVIIVIGPVKNMAKTMNLADIVIGVARVAVEAMACRKPVIVSGGVVGHLGGNFGGIVTKQNINELKDYNFSGRNSPERVTSNRIAEAVIRLLADDKYRRSLGDFGRRFVEREYDIQKIVRQIEDVYYDVVEKYKKR